MLPAAEHHVARPGARLLVHEVGRWSWGLESASGMGSRTKEARALSDLVSSIVAQRSGRPLKEGQALLKRRETWLSAQEALALSLVDEVA